MSENKNNAIKTNLRALRKQREITQEELASELGLTRQSIIAIEKGDCTPSLCHALKISEFFDKKVEDMFHFE